MKTDPQNTDYVMERGATRNYEPWREKEKDLADAVAEREEEERGNAMKVGGILHSLLSNTDAGMNPELLFIMSCSPLFYKKMLRSLYLLVPEKERSLLY